MAIQYIPPVTWVDTPEEFDKFKKRVLDTKECALDTETTGLNIVSDHILFWSACPDENSRFCFSAEMLVLLDQELINLPYIKWYFTNQNFDLNMLQNSGVRTPTGNCYDTLVMDWLFDENRQGRHGLKETARDHIGLHMRSFKEAFLGSHRGETIQERLLRGMENDFMGAISYSSLDAWATFKVFHFLKGELKKLTSLDGVPLWDHFIKIEMPFTRVLYNCSRRGFLVDVGYLDDLGPKIQYELDSIQKQINKIAGKEINSRSPMQLRELFFDKLRLDPVKRTAGGASGNRQFSTDAESLNIWAEQGIEPAKLMVRYRSLSTTKNTFIDGLKKCISKDHRIHPTLNQHITVTGRISSSNPNLMNIPNPEHDQFLIRAAFISDQGKQLIVSDYKQGEMRLLAHYSQDENMIDVIRKGLDIHTGTASLMYNYKYEDIEAALKKKKGANKDPNIILSPLEKRMCDTRRFSKAVGFGLNYDQGPGALAKTLDIEVQEAKKLIELYFKPYPKVKQFIYNVHSYILDHAMVETILGRPRRFHELHEIGRRLDTITRWELPGSAKSNLAQAERQSVNSIIQGSMADVAKLAMLNCEHDLQLESLGVQMLLQIHDELVFEVPEENIEKSKPIIKQHMEHPLKKDLLVPLDIDMGTGYSWASAKG